MKSSKLLQVIRLCTIHTDKQGFTLLEVIVTIIVAAIMGTMLVQFMGTNLIKSTKPAARVQKQFTLNEIMDDITADHKKFSAENEEPLVDLKTKIDSGLYGTYTSQTGYIKFSGGAEAVDDTGNNRVLKVTITSGDQTLTALFTK